MVVAPPRHLLTPPAEMVVRHETGLRVIRDRHGRVGELLRQVTRVEHFGWFFRTSALLTFAALSGMRPTPGFERELPKKSSATRKKLRAVQSMREKKFESFQG